MKDDFLLHTKAKFLGNWVNYHRKAGWIILKLLDGNSSHINAVEHGDGLTSLQFRRTADAVTEKIKSKITKTNIIQLERKGSTCTMRVAKCAKLLIECIVCNN
jgi:TolB protein